MRHLPDTPKLPVNLEAEHERYLAAATSERTRRTYRSAIRQFERWGGKLPTDELTLIRYCLDRAKTLNPRSLDIHITAISRWHYYQGLFDPTKTPRVHKTLEGIRRVHGRPKNKAKALQSEQLRAVIGAIDERPLGPRAARDRALLLTGFFGGFRRSELTALSVSDLLFETLGAKIVLPRSKTDQTGEGMVRAIPRSAGALCPVTALERWLELSGIESGPVFRPVNRHGGVLGVALSSSAVSEIVKSCCKAAGIADWDAYSGHSLRSGMATSASRAGANFANIKRQGGWRSDHTVWEYIAEGRAYEDNVGNALHAALEP